MVDACVRGRLREAAQTESCNSGPRAPHGGHKATGASRGLAELWIEINDSSKSVLLGRLPDFQNLAKKMALIL